jgi:hypothetical protein
MVRVVPVSLCQSVQEENMAPLYRSREDRRQDQIPSLYNSQPAWLSTRHLPAIIAGLVIATLFIGVEACSKSSTRSNIAPPTTPAAAAPSTAGTAANPAPSPTPAPMKKAKSRRRRPSPVVTYANKDYGISLRYPRKYDLRLGDEAQQAWPGLGPVQTGFLKPGGLTVATLEMPDNSYPGTDFATGFVSVSVHSGLTAAECMQFSAEQKETAVDDPARIQIGSLEFRELEKIRGQDLKRSDVKYYHAFQNSACYEFALGVRTVGDDPEQRVAEVDRAKVFSSLERILSSVKFKSVEVPITAQPADSGDNAPPAESLPTTVPSLVPPARASRT